MEPQEEFASLFERMYQLCNENNWGDPFNYSRAREIHMANTLGHQLADNYSGADAIDQDGECEYKSTISPKINATYNGISVKPTWEEQVLYLQNEKIGKYHNHYYARYQQGTIVEIYKMTGEKVLDYAIPKLETKYNGQRGADPRLGICIPHNYITQNAELIFPVTVV
mgnify:CR=1 FL=1